MNMCSFNIYLLSVFFVAGLWCTKIYTQRDARAPKTLWGKSGSALLIRINSADLELLGGSKTVSRDKEVCVSLQI